MAQCNIYTIFLKSRKFAALEGRQCRWQLSNCNQTDFREGGELESAPGLVLIFQFSWFEPGVKDLAAL